MNLSKVGYVEDIEKATMENDNFRKVLYTGKLSQLVVMSLKPGEEIGDEVHPDVDQFFRVESGQGILIMNGEETTVVDDFAMIVPAGVKHNLKNTGSEVLKLYTVYSPPNHPEGTVHSTYEEAMEAEHDH